MEDGRGQQHPSRRSARERESEGGRGGREGASGQLSHPEGHGQSATMQKWGEIKIQLLEDLDLTRSDLLDHLYAEGVLDSHNKDYVQKGAEDRTDRAHAERLLNCLLQKDVSRFKKLAGCLRTDTCTAHLADLLDGLTDAEISEIQQDHKRTSDQSKQPFHDIKKTTDMTYKETLQVKEQINDSKDREIEKIKLHEMEHYSQHLLEVLHTKEKPKQLQSAVETMEKDGSLVIAGTDKSHRSRSSASLLNEYKGNYTPLIIHDANKMQEVKQQVQNHIIWLKDILGESTISKAKATALSEVLPGLFKDLLKKQCPLLISLSTQLRKELEKGEFCHLLGSIKTIYIEEDKVSETNAQSERSQHDQDASAPLSTSSLHIACSAGDVSAVMQRIQKGDSLSALDSDGQTPLHVACNQQHEEVVKVLLDLGAQVNETDKRGQSALHHACAAGHVAIIDRLVRSGARCTLLDHDMNTPLHVACQSGQSGALQAMLCLLNSVPCPGVVVYSNQNTETPKRKTFMAAEIDINVVNQTGDSLLHLASRKGHIMAVSCLLNNGADVNQQNDKGDTALHDACRHGHSSVVGALLSTKASTEMHNLQGQTPLHVAASLGYQTMVQMLMNNEADAAAVDIRERRALHLASEQGHDDVVQILPQNNININASDKSGMTALHLASFHGHAVVVRGLLQRGADKDALDSSGHSPLFLACQFGHIGVVENLLQHKCLISAADHKRTSALHVASFYGHKEVVQLLLKQGCEVGPDNQRKETPLHLAVTAGHDDVALVLLEAGACAKARDLQGRTVLHMICLRNCSHILDNLLQHNTGINVQDSYGRTALHYASQKGNKTIVQMLIAAGANMNVADYSGLYPLHMAVSGRHKDIAEFLMQKGVSVDKADEDGFTALHSACQGGHNDIA